MHLYMHIYIYICIYIYIYIYIYKEERQIWKDLQKLKKNVRHKAPERRRKN